MGPFHPVNFNKANVSTFKIPKFRTYRIHKFGLKKKIPENPLSFPTEIGFSKLWERGGGGYEDGYGSPTKRGCLRLETSLQIVLQRCRNIVLWLVC